MTLHAAYDPDNIFARLLRGEVPAVKVLDDDVALAFMDIFPQARGHTLVIPKDVTARNLLELPTDRLGPYMQRVQAVARAVDTALKPDGIVITQFNGAAAGQTVYHLHFHVIPRVEGTAVKGHGQAPQADPAELESLAQMIRAAL